jgi:hypothetical protein
MELASHIIAVGDGKQVTLRWREFNEEVDLDKILVIDYTELIAETLTFPVIMNKFGFLLADIQNKLSSAKVDFEVFEAKKKQEIRNEFVEQGSKFTINQVDEALVQDKVWQIKKKQLIKTQKNLDYVNSVYWSAKEKLTLLQKISVNITETDLKNIKTSVFNHVKINVHEQLMK